MSWDGQECRNLLDPLNQIKADSEILTCWVARKTQSQALLGLSLLLQLPKKSWAKILGIMAEKTSEEFPPAFDLPHSPLKRRLSKGTWSEGAS